MRLAARGARDLDQGTESIADPTERSTLRRQARAVHLQALTRAVFLTVLAFGIGALVQLSR
ncbi:MAG: hypothetical protein OEY20_06935 [Gemmatimonadota bacterium]|nr:hypothetical protein [Gemmatimonadota bacterium]MDH4350062.1 hypothetical protein [Gemmatimonadota bacterium]MDH5196970.1 hypothetical protein [Gemmatimonadota bacterium]